MNPFGTADGNSWQVGEGAGSHSSNLGLWLWRGSSSPTTSTFPCSAERTGILGFVRFLRAMH